MAISEKTSAIDILEDQIAELKAENADDEIRIENTKQDIKTRGAKIKALEDAIERIRQSRAEDYENLPPEVEPRQVGTTEGIISLLRQHELEYKGSGMSGKEITDNLESRISTKSDNPRHVIRTTLHQLVGANKLLVDEDGIYRIPQTNRNGRH